MRKAEQGQAWDQKALRRESEACGQSGAGSRAWSERSRVRAVVDMWSNQIGETDKTGSEETCV